MLARSVVVCIAIAALAVTTYAVIPIRFRASGSVVVQAASALLLLAAGTVFAVRSTMRARVPALRAAESLAAVVSLLIVTFAYVHLLTSTADAAAFSEPLDRVDALYFAMTTSTTIGFGDIAPRTHAARIVVMVHMLANVLVIGLAARIVVRAAQRRLR